MTLPVALPGSGNTDWYGWAEAVDTAHRASAFLDVDGMFGGGWSGVKLACDEAKASGGPSAVVMLGKGVYDVTDMYEITEPDDPFTIMGGGIRGTRFRHAGAYAGPVFRVTDMKRNGQWESTVNSAPINTYDESADDGGMTFRGFSIVDDDRSTSGREGIYLIDADDVLIDDVQFGMLTGTALKVGGDEADIGISGVTRGRVRESDFRRVRIYRCGDGSPDGTPDVPSLLIQNGTGSQGDGTNQNFFHQLRWVYNEGRFLIQGRGPGGNSLRRTIFRDSQFHALADNQNWNPSKWFPFDMITIEGAVRETLFDGFTMNGNKAGTFGFRIAGHPSSAVDGDQPKRVAIRNANVVNMAGGFVKVEKCDTVNIEGQGMHSCSEGVLNADSGAGPGTSMKFSVHEYGIQAPTAGDYTLNGASGTILNHLADTGIA